MKLEEIKYLNEIRLQNDWFVTEDGDLVMGGKLRILDGDVANNKFLAAAPAMADMLIKLADFEVTEGFLARMVTRIEAIMKNDPESTMICSHKKYAQVVIDLLREDIAG